MEEVRWVGPNKLGSKTERKVESSVSALDISAAYCRFWVWKFVCFCSLSLFSLSSLSMLYSLSVLLYYHIWLFIVYFNHSIIFIISDYLYYLMCYYDYLYIKLFTLKNYKKLILWKYMISRLTQNFPWLYFYYTLSAIFKISLNDKYCQLL